jgi:hypothetical protein
MDAAGGQQLFDHTQPKREPKIQPDGVADNLGWEPVTGIAGASSSHHPHPTTHLDALAQAASAKLTVP